MALVEIISTVTARKNAARHVSAPMAAQVSVDWGLERWDLLPNPQTVRSSLLFNHCAISGVGGVAQPAAVTVRIVQPRNNRPALRVPESRVETRVSLTASSGKAGRLHPSRFYAFVAFADRYGTLFDLPSVD